ncbi:MAG: transposase [Myxococcota bacterium]
MCVTRLARVVIPGIAHHVTQRGARRMKVFFGPEDYSLYKSLLRERARSAGVGIRAYCLMPNHVHLIVIPERIDSLARLFRTVHSHYAELVNARRGWTGHLWQQRFASFPMHDFHLRAALDYVHWNPVRAGLAARPDDWLWTSAAVVLGQGTDDLVSSLRAFDGALTHDPGTTTEFEELRRCSRTGRPLGPNAFVRELEKRVGRPLLPQRRGPKPRSEPSGSP